MSRRAAEMRRLRPACLSGLALGLALCAGAAGAQTSIDAASEASPRWGAIAAQQQLFGYAFDQPTRAAAEQAARAQCAAAVAKRGGARAKGSGACEVRAAFNRQCAALAFGNFGEWGAASAPTREQAARDAAHQCNEHLPTEPCKVAVQVCSTAP